MDDRIEGIRVDARSLGGIATTLAFPELDLCIDQGTCTPAALRCGTLALTHTHADHLAGLPAYLGTRRLYGMPPPRILCPDESAEPLQRFVDILGELQGRPFETRVEGVPADGEADLGKGLFLRRFRVSHTIPATGWVLLRRVRKLRPGFVGLPGDEIARRKALPDGDAMFELLDDPLVAVTGDTTVEGLDLSDPLVRNAKVLFIEATFVDHRRDIAAAHWGAHTHLDELVPVLEGVACRTIVLYHFSQLYSEDEVRAAVLRRLPSTLVARVRLLPAGEGERL